MDFGKLSEVSHVDFSLPDDAPQTKLVLEKYKNTNAFKVWIGCPVWSQKEWVGKIYPAQTKPQEYLKEYAQQFNSIELNTTHYNIPSNETIEKWKKSVQADASKRVFRFSPKFPQPISHEKIFQKQATILTNEFCNAIQGLGDCLGLSFLQLPPTFEPQHLPLLAYFLENFPKEILLSIEFRNAGWFKNNIFEKAGELLEKYQISTVITDVSGRRDVLHQRLTNSRLMIRFVGNMLHATDYSRIDAWVERLQTWQEQGLNELYFFCHEPDNTLAPELAFYLIEKLNKTLNLNLIPPYIRHKGTQGSLF